MIIEIDTLQHPGVEVFAALTERQLRSRLDTSAATIIVESPKVIHTALAAGLEPLALLCEQRHIAGDAAAIIQACPGIPVYTGPRAVLEGLTGYTLTRGVLCAMRRPAPLPVADICRGARRLLVIDGVSDTTNIGAMYRTAAALGIGGVLLTPQSCDPLNRRSIRTSMGTVFQVPWAWLDGPVEGLHAYGFKTAAMALRHDSVALDDPALMAEPRLAIVMGTEGDGLDPAVIARADYTVCIPMARGVDSLNVAAAAAIACWQLR